jgi:long-chain acyl-CoA synthetase
MSPAGRAATIPQLLTERARLTPEATAYRSFEAGEAAWKTFTWGDVATSVDCWRAALVNEGLRPGERVAIQCANGLDWVCFDQAALSLGLVVVPLFVADAPATSAYILGDTEARLLLVDGAAQWDAVSRHTGAGSIIRVLCRMGSVPRGDPRIWPLREWLAAAPPAPALPLPTDPEVLATIVYTSGTTGRPKGVMLSHRNMLAVADAILERAPGTAADVFLSYLPLAHIFERVVGCYVPLRIGATVVFARSVKTLKDDLLFVRPSILLVVPSLLERIRYAVVARTTGRRPRRWLLEATVAAGVALYEARRDRRSPGLIVRLVYPLLRRLVARRVLERLGGRVRLVVTGGAPLDAKIARFFLGLDLPLIEGYGLTETSSAVTAGRLGDYVPGTAGPPLEGVEIQIGTDGEVLVRSPGNMLGYWKAAEKTAEVLREGWLRTGDIGEIVDGRLCIYGRLDDVVKLSTGEKFSPVAQEAALRRDPLFAQALVVGTGRHHPVALVVLDEEAWCDLAARHGLDPDAASSLRHELVTADVKARLRACMSEFPTYSRVRTAHLLLEPWSVENGLLTPTLKPKRAAIERRFAGDIRTTFGDRAERV